MIFLATATASADSVIGIAAGLGIGLLIGAERERRKGEGPGRGPAGLRTFALVAVMGGAATALDSPAILAIGGAFVAIAALAGYVLGDRSDPGVTTEFALLLTYILGALAYDEPTLAAGIGVTVACLLAARTTLHSLVANAVSEEELHDALLFAAAALVIWPLVPNEGLGPYEAINPFKVWRLVVLMMGISGLGYVALRSLGPRFGLPLAGFAAGFVSSAATIGAMGARAKKDPAALLPAVAGAVLSTVATVLQMALVVSITDQAVLRELALPLIFAGVAAAGYGAIFAARASRSSPDANGERGRAFDLRGAATFALVITAVLFASTVVTNQFGASGLVLSTAAAGFADTHAAAASAASVAAQGTVSDHAAVLPILLGLTTNAMTKMVVAFVSGPRRFAVQVTAGVAVVIGAAWAGLLAGSQVSW